jgi:hypothetical protein
MSTGPQVANLFSTPVVTLDVADSGALNSELRATIEQREKSHPGTQHSNLGGWQSDWDMDRWGGAAAIKLLAIGRNTANRITTNRRGPAGRDHLARQHVGERQSHGPRQRIPLASRQLLVRRLLCRRWRQRRRSVAGRRARIHGSARPGLAMYAPHLAFGSAGPSVGANETMRPKAGRLVMFPAWLLHQVRPYTGTAERISIAFNLSL